MEDEPIATPQVDTTPVQSSSEEEDDEKKEDGKSMTGKPMSKVDTKVKEKD